MNDLKRAAINLFISNVIKVIVLLGGLDLDGAEQLLIIGTVDSGIVMFFLIWKNGQGSQPVKTEVTTTIIEDKGTPKP